jgi:hypothetical protein
MLDRFQRKSDRLAQARVIVDKQDIQGGYSFGKKHAAKVEVEIYDVIVSKRRVNLSTQAINVIGIICASGRSMWK